MEEPSLLALPGPWDKKLREILGRDRKRSEEVTRISI
jgi:hypothetical protein